MEHPNRVAFCKILFGRNGGEFTALGLPVMQDLDDDGIPVRGKCDRAWDCGECLYLQDWLAQKVQEGWWFGWECVRCLTASESPDAESGIERHVQGFYQSGRNPSRTETDLDYDPDRPGLAGCTSCGWESSFLQLVLRRRPCSASSAGAPFGLGSST